MLMSIKRMLPTQTHPNFNFISKRELTPHALTACMPGHTAVECVPYG